MPRLLVASYAYPPLALVGSNRWEAMVRHLRRLGAEVTVITTAAAGVNATGPVNEAGVIRVPDVFAAPRVRRVLGAPPRPSPGEPPAGLEAIPVHERVLVPDPKVLGWLPLAARAARRMLSERRFDCLITASPFESTHLLGVLLGRSRPAWLADLRDGWTFEPWRAPLPTAAQRALDRRLEESVLARADAVSSASRAVAVDLERRLHRPLAVVPNGWDPDLESAIAQASRAVFPSERDGVVKLVYTGTLWKTAGQDPSPLFDALARLRREEPGLTERLELIVAGPLGAAEAHRLADPPLAGLVRHVGQLSRAEALALQRRADALVLFTSAERNLVTGKLFEYLFAGRPILAVAGEDEAAAIVRATGTGTVVPHHDEAAIVSALRDAADGRLAEAYRPHDLERYRYPAPAEAMLAAVREAIAHRGAR